MPRPRPQLRAIVRLTNDEHRLAGLLAEFLAERPVDLGDERTVAQAILDIPNESLPRARLTDPIFDAALEQARALRQGRQI